MIQDNLNPKTSPDFRALHYYSNYEFTIDELDKVATKIFQDKSLYSTFGIISGVLIGGYPFVGTYFNRSYDCIVSFDVYIHGRFSYSVNASGSNANRQ